MVVQMGGMSGPPPNFSGPPPNHHAGGGGGGGGGHQHVPKFPPQFPPTGPNSMGGTGPPVIGPDGQPVEFDGKRLRKTMMRKTVDYNSSFINMLHNRVNQHCRRNQQWLNCIFRSGQETTETDERFNRTSASTLTLYLHRYLMDANCTIAQSL